MFLRSRALGVKSGSKSRGKLGSRKFSRRLEALEQRLTLSVNPSAPIVQPSIPIVVPPPLSIVVTTTDDVVDPNDGLTSLREAIQQANSATGPAVIWLGPATYQLSAAAGELQISNSVSIGVASVLQVMPAGGGPLDGAVIDGGGQTRVFHIQGANVAVSLSGLTIQGGHASGGGGAILDTATNSQLTLTDCMVNGNVASGDGGAIDEAAGTSALSLVRCTIANNTSGGNGGGIEIASTNTTTSLTNCTIYGNSATGHGGALADDSSGGTITIVNDTIDANSSGLFQQHATINIGNSIVAKNGNDVTGAFHPISDSNVIGNSDGSDISFMYVLPMFVIEGLGGPPFGYPKIVGTASHPVDPRLGPLADNGGLTLTQALLPDSPAIGMGARNGAPDVDQRGVVRPDGNATDIGAYEFTPPTPVISQATAVPRAGGSRPAWVGSQTLIVDGTGFYPDSILRVNGQDLRTYFESPTELRAIVGDLMIKGMTSFSVTVFTPGGRESSSVDVPISMDPPSQGPISNPPPNQAATPNEKFVNAIYQSLLHRAPDAQGLAFWTDFLGHEGTRSQLIDALLASREYVSGEVETLFQTYLHRSADPDATNYFESYLAAGGNSQHVAAVLAGSPEYLHAHGDSVEGLLDALFHDALARDVDPESRTFFEHELATGMSRQQIAAQVFASGEYLRDVVNGRYVEFLGRSADAEALDHFAAALKNGLSEQELIEQIAASDEFFKDATS